VAGPPACKACGGHPPELQALIFPNYNKKACLKQAKISIEFSKY